MNRCPSDGCNNTSVINPKPVILVVIFCICCLLSFAASAHAIDRSADKEWSNGSSSSSILPATVDRFGVEMLYPTKAAGQEWYLDMVNPTSDGRFNPQDQITRNSDGSWKMRSDQVRMQVYTSNGYNPHQITSDSGQSKVATRGFMGSLKDWRDVEITGYVKLNQFSENDNFVWYTRGGRHTDSDHCQGSSYKGNLFYHGETQFSKEQWHVSYEKSPTIAATSPLSGKWIGFKFVVYNFMTNDGKPAVKLENWIDANADGKNWQKVYEGGDSGKWGRSGAECQVKADQIITWGGPIATFRWDFARDVDFRNLSVREITGDNVTSQGIHYFTGSSTSSNVPKFGHSNGSSTGGQDENTLLSGALGNKFANSNLVNRSLAINHAPSPNSNSQNNEASGESFDQQQVSSGTNVYVLWVQGDEDNTDLYLKISHDGGATFGDTINLSDNPASLSYHPKIVASGENVYIVWEDDEGKSGNSDIFFMKSSDAGKTFTSKSDLSNDPSGSGTPQLSVSDGNVYVAWMGTSPDNTDIFLAQSSNDGNSFTVPANISNDPDISFNPILSVNGTHVFVEWTDQDESGLTRTKSKTLPHTTYGSQNNAESYADLSGDLNSTDSSSALLQGQNSTYVRGNESRTEIQIENLTDTVALNQSAVVSNWDASSLSSNSNYSFNSSFEPLDTTTIQGPKLDNHTETNDVDVIDLSSFSGKLLADKIEGERNVKINGTLGDQVKENSQSEADTNSGRDGNPENIRVEWLAALTAAEEALKIKESQKMEHNTSSYEKVPLTSAMGEEKKTIQPLPTKEQKRAESVAPLQPNPTSTAKSLSDHDVLAATSRHTEPEDLNHTHLNVVQGANKVQPAKVQPEQVDKDRQQQQKETQQQRSKEKAIVVKDKPVGTSPSQDSHSGNKILSQSTDREHAEGADRKKITNLQIQKMKDQQKTMDQKRIIKSEEAKEQRQKKEVRDTVQSLVSEADAALKNANALIKKSKQANQKAQDAIEEVKSRQAKTENDQKENNGRELSQLINEAKISDQKAKVAQEKYNDLRKVADKAVEKYIAKFK
jgi:hypothetical protein